MTDRIRCYVSATGLAFSAYGLGVVVGIGALPWWAGLLGVGVIGAVLGFGLSASARTGGNHETRSPTGRGG